MVRVVPIDLPYNSHVLWFDPCDFDLHKDDYVVVKTSRGIEFGQVAGDIFEVSQKRIKALKSKLKPIVRIATDEDVEHAKDLKKRGQEALPFFKKIASSTCEDMRPISVEFLFDDDKAVFYFEAEDRVDFRELVRKLAGHFHLRVDMHQIGVRDEARIVGGIGHCGQELCCKRFSGDFNPVSIRMAKEQDLSLNPQKISGLCGRLMCCLRYEYDAYKDFKSRAPKLNDTIDTPLGDAKVVGFDVPREVVSLSVEDDKTVSVPLADFDACDEGCRPCAVCEKAWEKATTEFVSGYPGESALFASSELISNDDIDENEAYFNTEEFQTDSSQADIDSQSRAASLNSTVEKGSSNGRKKSASDDNVHKAADKRKSRRRRSTKITSGASNQKSSAAVRPGQKSSGLAHNEATFNEKSSKNTSVTNKQKKRSGQTRSGNGTQNKQRAEQQRNNKSAENTEHRRQRRRGHTIETSHDDGISNKGSSHDSSQAGGK